MPAAEQIDVEFDQRLQDIGGAWNGIAGLELLSGHRQKAMVRAEDAQLSRLALVEMLRGQFHLAAGDLRRAIQADGGDAVGAVEVFGGLEMIEKLPLSPAIDVLERLHFVEQRRGFGVRQQEVFQVAAFRGPWHNRAGGIAVTRDKQDLAEIQ